MDIETQIVTFLQQQRNDIALIYVFGSYADGTANAESDLDIALLTHQPLANIQRFELAQQLASHIHKDVDLVDLNQASTVLQMQVLSTGRKLFGDNTIDDLFGAKVFSMYSRLQESRKAIIDDFLASDA